MHYRPLRLRDKFTLAHHYAAAPMRGTGRRWRSIIARAAAYARRFAHHFIRTTLL